jgi:hypothetical protein
MFFVLKFATSNGHGCPSSSASALRPIVGGVAALLMTLTINFGFKISSAVWPLIKVWLLT